MTSRLASILGRLQGDEYAIADASLSRLSRGRRDYGPWNVHDGRRYPREALEEVIDALHYCAAELVRMDRQHIDGTPAVLKVYVCHPLGNGNELLDNLERVQELGRELVAAGVLPIAPQVYLTQFVDERLEPELADQLRTALLMMCDELWVFGEHVDDVMRTEIEQPRQLGMTVIGYDKPEVH